MEEVFFTNNICPAIDNWSCFERLSYIITTHKNELTVKILKYLKALSKLAPPNLKQALFIKVFLPFVLTCKDVARSSCFSKIYRKMAVSLTNPYDSGYGTPTEGDATKGTAVSSSQEASHSEEALKISLTAILMLLEKQTLRSSFLKLGGVNCIVNFLGDKSLHRICLGILQVLASQREDSASEERKQNEDSPKDINVKPNGADEVVNVLLRSMLLLDPREGSSQIDSPVGDFAQKIQTSLCLPEVSQMLCQLWRCCFYVLKRNGIFRKSFLTHGGSMCIITVLQVVKERLYKAKSTSDVSLTNQIAPCILLMECAMVIGLEFSDELVDGVQVIALLA